ncbi:MAG: hypothetical protein REDVDVYQ_000773 [Candidatus Fervidibacter sp.]
MKTATIFAALLAIVAPLALVAPVRQLSRLLGAPTWSRLHAFPSHIKDDLHLQATIVGFNAQKVVGDGFDVMQQDDAVVERLAHHDA